MPIYAYRCAACGHSKDVLQKLSDPVLTTCPSCGAEAFTKQVTAAGFQLKGSGWYATDFKGGPAPADKPADAAPADAKADAKPDAKGDAPAQPKGDAKSAPKTEGAKSDAPAASSPSPAAPASGSAGS